MSFELPTRSADIASTLRELEQNAPRPTSKEIREALIQAAQKLDDQRKLFTNIAAQLEEAANIRISEMASTSAVNDIQRGVKSTLLELARRCKGLA